MRYDAPSIFFLRAHILLLKRQPELSVAAMQSPGSYVGISEHRISGISEGKVQCVDTVGRPDDALEWHQCGRLLFFLIETMQAVRQWSTKIKVP